LKTNTLPLSDFSLNLKRLKSGSDPSPVPFPEIGPLPRLISIKIPHILIEDPDIY
jgi:hypothetical protein